MLTKWFPDYVPSHHAERGLLLDGKSNSCEPGTIKVTDVVSETSIEITVTAAPANK